MHWCLCYSANHLAEICRYPSLCPSRASTGVSPSLPGTGERFMWDNWLWCSVLPAEQVLGDLWFKCIIKTLQSQYGVVCTKCFLAALQLHFVCYSFVFLKLSLTVFGTKLCKHVLFTFSIMLTFHCLISLCSLSNLSTLMILGRQFQPNCQATQAIVWLT